jgi:hypothetical protein
MSRPGFSQFTEISITHITKVIASSPRIRTLLIGQLNRYASIRDIVLMRFPRARFELARMRERKILKAFLELERERLLDSRDAEENCLLLLVAGYRGCISGVICDLLAASFDPHRCNVHRRTASNRYKMTSRVRHKQGVCLWNYSACSHVWSRVATCD